MISFSEELATEFMSAEMAVVLEKIKEATVTHDTILCLYFEQIEEFMPYIKNSDLFSCIDRLVKDGYMEKETIVSPYDGEPTDYFSITSKGIRLYEETRG